MRRAQDKGRNARLSGNLRALVSCLLPLAFLGCGTNNITNTPTATATAASTPTATASPLPINTATPTPVPATPSPPPATLLFSLDVTDPHNPFPSDRLLDVTGHVQLPAGYLDPGLPATGDFQTARDYLANVMGQLSALSGFSTFAPIRLRFDRAVVVDAGANPRGLLLLEYDDLKAPPPVITASPYDPETTIEVQPRVPLKAKTTYALVVTNALTDASGSPVRPSPAFAQLLAATSLSPDLVAWRARLQPVIDYVQSTFNVGPESLVLVDLFTTEPTTDDLVAIQQRLVSGDLVPGPPLFQNSPIQDLDTGIFPEGTPEFTVAVGSPTSANIDAVAIGSFASYDFRSGPVGAFDPDLLHGPKVPRVNNLDFYVTIPKQPPPAGGYPIVIFGHGLGGSDKDVVSGVPFLVGDAPVMGIAISAVQHGRRGNPLNFFVFNNIAATREFFRQTVADFMQLERMVRNAHSAGVAPFDQVDTGHVMYFGISLGGIMGSMYMAVEPDVVSGVLSVPGGGLPNILDSHDIGGLLEPLLSLSVGIPRDNPSFPLFLHRFQQMSQWVLDAADPINYGPHMITPGAQLPNVPVKRVLVHEGIIDNTIPNRTTDDLALATRLPDLNLTHGCTGGNSLAVAGAASATTSLGCSGIWRYVMTDYGAPELSGHSVTFTIPQAQRQAGEFLANFGTAVIDAAP